MNETLLRQAMARGYCTPENEKKELDSTLIEAMIKEILSIQVDAEVKVEAKLTEVKAIVEAEVSQENGGHTNKDIDRGTIEIMTDLVCKYRPDIIKKYGGLSKFIGWIRSLNTKKLYVKLKR